MVCAANAVETIYFDDVMVNVMRMENGRQLEFVLAVGFLPMVVLRLSCLSMVN